MSNVNQNVACDVSTWEINRLEITSLDSSQMRILQLASARNRNYILLKGHDVVLIFLK